MDDYLKTALDLVRAQATVRPMTEDEMMNMAASLAEKLEGLISAGPVEVEPVISPAQAKAAIKEKSVTCLECGAKFKILTARHLAKHGLTPKEYLEKYGYKNGTRLVCKSLARARREKMGEMRLWERRGKGVPEIQPEPVKEAPKSKAKKKETSGPVESSTASADV